MTLRPMGVLESLRFTSLLIASASPSSLCTGDLFCRASATLQATPELIARQPQTGLPCQRGCWEALVRAHHPQGLLLLKARHADPRLACLPLRPCSAAAHASKPMRSHED